MHPPTLIREAPKRHNFMHTYTMKFVHTQLMVYTILHTCAVYTFSILHTSMYNYHVVYHTSK